MRETSKIAIIVAAVSLIGALGGSYIGGYFARVQRAEDRAVERQRFVLEQRQKLLDQLTAIVNSRARAEKLRALMEVDDKLLDMSRECYRRAVALKSKLEPCKHDLHRILEVQKEFVELNARYASTLQLSHLTFGPEVGAAIDPIRNTQWWLVNPEEHIKLFRAMRKDIEAVRF